ncbi:hypothetical protein AC249_AIPGENE6162 [Exaiptasia diaphana]|nr:hypothetical protein AC249_AIPGENE6162 [Exaiptasia diaphana]
MLRASEAEDCLSRRPACLADRESNISWLDLERHKKSVHVESGINANTVRSCPQHIGMTFNRETWSKEKLETWAGKNSEALI